ncbi:MAG: hypothetical protein IIA67_03210 [Planctomycetes bacterium]|nr:hypothetical protein [Planctomycetota bacterium]
MDDPTSPPQRPPEPGPPRGSCLGVLMVGVLISVALFALNFVTMGIFLVVALIGGAILLFSLFHYLVWGWWLGGMIRREAEAEEQHADDEA